MVARLLSDQQQDWVRITYDEISEGDLVDVVYYRKGKFGGQKFKYKGVVLVKTKTTLGIKGNSPIKRNWIIRIYKCIATEKV